MCPRSIPVLQKLDSTWVGWLGATGPPPQPFRHENVRHHPVAFSRKDVEDYYEGFCNATLWPLYHDAIRPPEYHRHWWRSYQTVNQRFAEATSNCVADGGTVWVQDYHLQLVPALLRKMRHDIKIGFFLHIPFPPSELFSQLPWRSSLLEGLLGADVVGFQTQIGADNFAQLCCRYTKARCIRNNISCEGKDIRVASFPISIDSGSFAELAAQPSVINRAKKLRAQLGVARKIVLGVDRLDYTKGIDRRLSAYRELLRSGACSPDDVVFVQVAVPSRERVADYRELRSRVEQLVGEINGEFGGLERTPVHYLHKSLDREELVALYVAAAVMVVTPFRDGMNLVAKEYVATRLDNLGVLVLSEFTGSAKQLKSALLVNPHDTDGLAVVIQNALAMTTQEQRKRMRSLRKFVRNNDVYQWADRFLGTLRSCGSPA